MNLDCDSIKLLLSSFAWIKECDMAPDGSLRLATPLLYPDGSHIDVFCQASNDLFSKIRLTDLGQTAAFLADLHVYINKNHEKREQIVSDISRVLNINIQDGELYTYVGSNNDLADSIVRLAQACIRVSDISYTHAFRNKTDFYEVFSDFVKQERPDNIEDFTIEGRFGRRIRTDFYARHRERPDDLIIVLSSANRNSSHHVANDVFCRWYDLDRYRSDFRFLTVLDSTSRAFLNADVDRVASVSRVISYPLELDTLREMLSF